MLLMVLLWIACATIGYLIGQKKGRATAGFWLGLLLGVIGIIIIACMDETYEHKVQRYRLESEARRAAISWSPPSPSDRQG